MQPFPPPSFNPPSFNLGDIVEAHSLETTNYNWKSGTVKRLLGERVHVDFGGSHGEKALKRANLRKAVPVRPPDQRYSTTKQPWVDGEHSHQRRSFRCFSSGCPYALHDDEFFGSFCCRWCHDSLGDYHGKLCQRIYASTYAPRGTEMELCINGGGLLKVWKTLAALSLCSKNGGFKSLTGATFRTTIFVHFMPPKCHFKAKPWIYMPCPELPSTNQRLKCVGHSEQSSLSSVQPEEPVGNVSKEKVSVGLKQCNDDDEASAVIMEGLEDAQATATIPQEEASQIANEQWASAVEMGIMAGAHMEADETIASEAGASGETLLVLTFGRPPQNFERALMESSLAQTLSAQGVNLKPEWAGGAKIFAKGVSADVLDKIYFDLGVQHILVAVDDELKVYEALQVLPYKDRPRLKASTGRFILDTDDLERFTDLSDDEQCIPEPGAAADSSDQYLPVKATFIHFSSSAGSSSARTVSTSAMRELAIGNPRSKAPRRL